MWLREILVAYGESPTVVAAGGSHSLKATLLSWAAKFGLNEGTRRLLGGHVKPGTTCILTYSRDVLAAPLRRLGRVLDAVASGGVTVNDTVMHCGQEDLPFGGVGASGHGRTRGRDGFRELSNVRGVHRQIGHAGLSQLVLDGLSPPYDRAGNIVDLYLWLKMRALRTARCSVM